MKGKAGPVAKKTRLAWPARKIGVALGLHLAGLLVEEGGAAVGNDASIAGAARLDLAAPEGALDVRGGLAPAMALDEADKGGKAGHAARAEVVRHVGENGVDAGALRAKDAARAALGLGDLAGKKLVALSLGQAAAIVVDFVPVAANSLDLGLGPAGVQVEAVADGLVARGVLVCARAVALGSLDERGGALAGHCWARGRSNKGHSKHKGNLLHHSACCLLFVVVETRETREATWSDVKRRVREMKNWRKQNKKTTNKQQKQES